MSYFRLPLLICLLWFVFFGQKAIAQVVTVPSTATITNEASYTAGKAVCQAISTSNVCTDTVNCLNIQQYHKATQCFIKNEINYQITKYEIWLEEAFWEDGIKASLPKMQSQISVAIQDKIKTMGSLMDSQIQQEAQLTIQKRKHKAEKSVQPSEEHCKAVTLSGGVIAAKESSRKHVANSMDHLKRIATSSSPVLTDKRQAVSIQKEHALCKYISRQVANGAMEEVCDSTEPSDEDQERAFIGNMTSKRTLDDDDQQALNAAAQGMFLSNRPSNYEPSLLAEDEMKLAHMQHRSVSSRELMSSYCFLKTFQHRMGGDSSQLNYIKAFLADRGITDPDQLDAFIGQNPSLYAQRKVLELSLSDPEFGMGLVDTNENVLKLSNIAKSYGISAKYDMLEALQCNQIMASQMLTDKILPLGRDLQEDVDSLTVAYEKQKNLNVVNARSAVNIDSKGM